MTNPKLTRIEVSGQGDIEVLDYALRNLGFGEIVRSPRFFNIKSLQYTQFTLTLGGKKHVWRPFRAEFARSAAGTYTATTANMSAYAQEMIRQNGFSVVKVELGDYPQQEIQPGMMMNSSGSINGRSYTFSLNTLTQ